MGPGQTADGPVASRENVAHRGEMDKHLIWASLRDDKAARMKGICKAIEAELEKGDVKEGFRLLKGWYQVASETVARPCPQTMA